MPNKKWPVCQICGKAVSTSQGVLTIYKKELDQYTKRHQEWEEKHPFDDAGSRVLNVVEFRDLPHLVDWHWGHSGCLADGMYWIEYNRFDTITKALSWTLHLMEKNWLGFTDWEGAVRAHYEIPHA